MKKKLEVTRPVIFAQYTQGRITASVEYDSEELDDRAAHKMLDTQLFNAEKVEREVYARRHTPKQTEDNPDLGGLLE